MKFSCEKALLQSAITTAGRAVSSKSSIAALEGILVEAQGHKIQFTGYNLETGITTTLEAETAQPGSTILPARLFQDIVRKLPDDMVSLEGQGSTVAITCGPVRYELSAMDARDFPQLPQVDEGNGLWLTQQNLRNMIAQILFAISDNESRPIHTGALFEVEGEQLTLVAVDGYRLALRREAILGKGGTAGFSFVVPGAALSEVEKICGDCEETVSITGGKRHITFQIGPTLLVARRLEGEFLNYRNTIPKNNAISVLSQTAALKTSIDRASLIINDKLKSPLRCQFDNGSLSITSQTAIGTAFDRCPIQGDGRGLEIGFNNRFLMDAVKVIPTPSVRLELNSPTSPCLLLPPEGAADNFLYMVLPVRLKARES